MDDRRIVRPTSRAGGHRAGERHALAATASGRQARRTPAVDPAERHFFGLVTPLYALDDFDVPQAGLLLGVLLEALLC